MNRATTIGGRSPTTRPFLSRSPHGMAALALTVVSVAVALVVSEIVLRSIGFHYETFPTAQFGWPEPEAIFHEYVPDRDLFWVPRQYAAWLRGARESGVNVVFLGDSCTEFGTYPRHVMERLANERPGLAHGIKLGVAGWSTEQGLAQLRRDVLLLHPRVITIYFGWNDHWVALGAPDDQARPSAVWFWLSQHLRLAELLVKARLSYSLKSLERRPNRVSLDRYRANLQAMVRLAHEHGAEAVLITAPSNHVEGHEPAYLAQRHVRKLQEVVPLHRSYAKATREAAVESRAMLCDAAEAFDKLAGPRDRLFMRDGIHLSEAGNLTMARLVADCVEHAVP